MDLEKVRQAAERVARSEGLEVADVEWKVGKQRFLRVYIDRVPEQFVAGDAASTPDALDVSDAGDVADGDEQVPASSPYPKITHGDCERVSQQLSVILDVEDLIPGPAYVLEVSSPGMDRALKNARDFARFRGRLAKIVTTEPVGDAKFFEGRISGVADGKVCMQLQGKQAKIVEIPIDAIRKANLVVEF
ncbi:MAG: ribosome maturation factor RimP [Acidobacteriota bacterium]|nr:ribosome maturation factor RimP [Acidobacteriota bacterium]